MKFSPVLPFALSSLITTTLAAPHALGQSGPVSVGRRSSDATPFEDGSSSSLTQSTDEAASDIGFGMGEPLVQVRDNEKRAKSAAAEAADNIGFGMGRPLLAASKKEKRQESAAAVAADDIGFGTGEPLLARNKEKRQESAAAEAANDIGFGTGEPLLARNNEKRQESAAEIAANDIGFGMGEELELVKEKRSESAAEIAANDIGFGSGEPLLAARDDPLIRRKIAELSALIKERAPGQSMSEVLARADSRLPNVAASAA